MLIRGLRLRLTTVLCWRTYPQAPDSPNYSVLGTLDDTYRTGKPAALPPSCNTNGYSRSSTDLAMGFAKVRAGTWYLC